MQKTSTEEVIVPDVVELAVKAAAQQAAKTLGFDVFEPDLDYVDPCSRHDNAWCYRCRVRESKREAEQRQWRHDAIMILMDDISLTPQQLRQAIGKAILDA